MSMFVETMLAGFRLETMSTCVETMLAGFRSETICLRVLRQCLLGSDQRPYVYVC